MQTKTKPEMKKKQVFMEGAISPEFIAHAIAKHQFKTTIGAHQIFLGQVRKDLVDRKEVEAIEYTCYEKMAETELERIREEAFRRYDLVCMHIYHSLGVVKAGGICLFVFVSSSHRKTAFEAINYIVEQIKTTVPVFGKEIFGDHSHQWKINK